MRFGIAKDAGVKHALEHRRARQPQLEMLPFDLWNVSQEDC